MSIIYIYPASFCPPTFGHLHTAQKAAEMFEYIQLVCSENPDKYNKWFSPEECAFFWKSYNLPKNISVTTIQKARKQIQDTSNVVMIRGIRNEDDAEYEKKVMFFNKEHFGIERYMYFMSNNGFQDISSTKARKAAQNLELEKMSQFVSPLITSRLLEIAIGARNIFMVVGKPGSGKSTFLRELCQNPENIHINTDEFSQSLKPLLKKVFGNENLINVAINEKDRLKEVIAKPWLKLLVNKLRSVPQNSNVFIEIPYGLQEDKSIFRLVGGKIIHVGCTDKTNRNRVIQRGTPELIPFVDAIPNIQAATEIATSNKLSLASINTEGSKKETIQKANYFDQWIKERGNQWKTYSPDWYLDI
ncbi:AAA family ATPase [Patescibacteria group bacterium]